MPRKRHTPEEIVTKLRQVDVLVAQGQSVADAVRSIGVTEGELRDELLDREIFYSLREAPVLIEAWRQHYNTVRPHSALGYRPPAPEAVAWPGPAWAPLHPSAGQDARVVYH